MDLIIWQPKEKGKKNYIENFWKLKSQNSHFSSLSFSPSFPRKQTEGKKKNHNMVSGNQEIKEETKTCGYLPVLEFMKTCCLGKKKKRQPRRLSFLNPSAKVLIDYRQRFLLGHEPVTCYISPAGSCLPVTASFSGKKTKGRALVFTCQVFIHTTNK